MSDQAQVLEEGEIADSSDSEKEISIKPINTNLNQHFQPIHSVPCTDHSVYSYRSTNNPCVDSSESSSDEEDENNSSPIKSKRGRPNIHMPPGYDNGGNHNAGFMQVADAFQKKHGKDVWNKVVLEQTIDDSIRQVNTFEKDDKHVDRGVESYDYKSAVQTLPEYVKSSRQTVDYGDDMFGAGDSEGDESDTGDIQDEDDNDKDICDIEQFGASETKLSAKHRLGLKMNEDGDNETDLCDIETFGTGASRKRTIKDRISKKIDKHSVNTSEHNSIRTEEDSGECGDRKSAKDRLGSRRPPICHKATFNLNCKETDVPEDVAMALVKALGEPQWQAEMFQRIVTTIGVKKSLEVFYMTENVEENGGMLILNGERRRSPGGVYIQLVKTDSATTKDMIHLMFPFQKISRKKNKHRKNKKESSMETRSPDSDVKDLPTKADVLLAESSVAMDTKAGPIDDLEMANDEVHIELDFPDS